MKHDLLSFSFAVDDIDEIMLGRARFTAQPLSVLTLTNPSRPVVAYKKVNVAPLVCYKLLACLFCGNLF